MTVVLILLASIFFNTAILVAFKYFAQFKVDTYKAIIFNYLVCVVMGMVFTSSVPLVSAIGEPYLPYMVFLGIFFVFGFYVAAQTVQYFGLTVTSILQRTSMVLTVIYAIIVFNESFGLTKFLAIVLAIAAVVLINLPFKRPVPKLDGTPVWVFLLPIGLFLVNGIIETMLFHIEAARITTSANLDMITGIFAGALITGIIFGLFRDGLSFFIFKKKTLLAGLGLGLPNYFSIYFLLKLLGSGWDGSVAVPLNNVGVLCLAALLGLVIFREQLTRYKAAGLVLAIISVILFSRVT